MTQTSAPNELERPRRRTGVGLVAVLGVLVASTMVWKASTAAFTASTSNGVNTFSTGTVALTDSDSSIAMFTAPPFIAPGDSGSACIRVTYNGSLASDVHVYTSGLSDLAGLGAQITMTIEEGATSPANATGTFSCTNFTPSGAAIGSGTLAALGGTNTTFLTGFGTWAPTGSAQTKDYRFSWTFASAAPDSVQNASVSIGFVWEARSN